MFCPHGFFGCEQFATLAHFLKPFAVHVHLMHQLPVMGTFLVPRAYHFTPQLGPADMQVLPVRAYTGEGGRV